MECDGDDDDSGWFDGMETGDGKADGGGLILQLQRTDFTGRAGVVPGPRGNWSMYLQPLSR